MKTELSELFITAHGNKLGNREREIINAPDVMFSMGKYSGYPGCIEIYSENLHKSFIFRLLDNNVIG